MPAETIPFDAAPYVSDAASREQLLADAFATGHAGYIAAAVDTIARAGGMAQTARGVKLSVSFPRAPNRS